MTGSITAIILWLLAEITVTEHFQKNSLLWGHAFDKGKAKRAYDNLSDNNVGL